MSEKRELDGVMELVEDVVSSTLFEKLAHGRIREGFVIGWAIIVTGTIGLLIWMHFHPNLNSNVTLSGCCFFLGIAILGSVLRTNTDLADQQAGLYSKSGSGWNLWGDNYIFNQIAKFLQTTCVLLCVGGTVYFALAASTEGAANAKTLVPAKTGAVSTTSTTNVGHSEAVHHGHSTSSRHSAKHSAHKSH